MSHAYTQSGFPKIHPFPFKALGPGSVEWDKCNQILETLREDTESAHLETVAGALSPLISWYLPAPSLSLLQRDLEADFDFAELLLSPALLITCLPLPNLVPSRTPPSCSFPRSCESSQ